MLYRKLGRRTEHRLAMLKNQVTSLIKYGAITTTLAKAKELRRVADWMVTWAKQGYITPEEKAGPVALKRRVQASGWIKEKQPLQDLFKWFALRFAQRKGGYTRVLRTGFRRGDAAPMARIEYVEWDVEEDKIKYEKEKAEREEKHAKLRKEVAEVLETYKDSAGIDAVRAVGKCINKVLYEHGERTDLDKLRKLYSKLQSTYDKVKSQGGELTPPPKPQPLICYDMPAEYKLKKVGINPFNKHGGRGLVPITTKK
eukprot:c8052_g1_i1.p1 GENE.c8052_g1_i1~~c8052_g1_i1.p1  ORF type:complete len:264 (+),score=118.00 c8052_g1_i1:25-792(+)